jgi:catechol 2,3-dioxygenase-like lactoylglutathione lyase family enzyme
MATRQINFVSVPVADQDRALAFYTGHLGFSVQTDAPYGEGWRWIFLALSGGGTRLHFARATELTWAEGLPALTLVTDDVNADAARFMAAGVEIVDGPADAPWVAGVRYLIIRDSEGNSVLMESLKGG